MTTPDKQLFNWPDVIKAIRTFVIEHTKIGTNFEDDLRTKMFQTDEFHATDAMDDLYSALSASFEDRASDYIDNVYEKMAYAIEDTGELILAYFNDKWNFAPGYLSPSKLVVPTANISSSILMKTLRSCAPELVNAWFSEATDEKKQRAEATKQSALKYNEQMPAIVDSIIAAIPRVIDYDFKITRKPSFWKHEKYLTLFDNITLGEAETTACQTPEELQALVKSKLNTSQYVNYLIEGLYNLDDKSMAQLLRDITTICRYAPSKTKLYASIASHV